MNHEIAACFYKEDGRLLFRPYGGLPIDVVDLIATAAEIDFSIVMQGVSERFGIEYSAPKGTVLS